MIDRVWIFDLDNTLHNATPHIFPHINRSMTAYLQHHLKLEEPAANSMRIDYWQRYGATLRGMMKHHATDPEHFLWHTHQFPALSQMILREPRLRHVLKKLPGKKIIFSNAPQHYAHAILKMMRIDDCFHDVFAIEHTRYQPKPQQYGFMRLLQKYRLQPARCVMVEDSVENLSTAKQLGMRTVWVSSTSRVPAYVDVKITNVLQLPRVLSQFNH